MAAVPGDERGADTDGGICTDADTERQHNAHRADGSAAHDSDDYADEERSQGCDDSAGQRLADGIIDRALEIVRAVEVHIFTDTVEHADGIVHRVTDKGQNRGDERSVHRKADERHETEGTHRIVNKADDSAETEAEAELAEPEPHIKADHEPGENHGKDCIEAEFLTNRRTDIILSDDLRRAGVHDSLRENSLYRGALGFTDAHLIGVVRAAAELADGEVRDILRGERLVQVLDVFRIIVVLHGIDLTAGEVDAVVEALEHHKRNRDDDERTGESEEELALVHELRTQFVQGADDVFVLLRKLDVENGVRNREGGKHGGRDTDHQSETEALDGAGADFVQNETGEDSREVRVEDGAERTFIAFLDCGAGFEAGAEFFTDTFVNDHVRIHRHTDRQDKACDTGERKRRAEHGEDCERDDHVAEHTDARDKTAEAVVGNHEHEDEDETDDAGTEAGLDVIVAERRADVAGFDNLHRSLESAGAENDSEAVRFGHVFKAGDLGFAVRNAVADHRRADDLVIKDDGHLLADVRCGDRGEFLGADAAELEAHGDFACIGAVTHAIRTRVGNIFTAHFGAALQNIQALGLDLAALLDGFEAGPPGEDDVVRNHGLDGRSAQELLDLFNIFLTHEPAVADGKVELGKRNDAHGSIRGSDILRRVFLFSGLRFDGGLTGEEVFVRNIRCGLSGDLRRILRGDLRSIDGLRRIDDAAVRHIVVDHLHELHIAFLLGEDLEFQFRGTSDEGLGGGVVHASEIHENAVIAARSDLRFGKAELDHAVADDFEGLRLDVLDFVALETRLVDFERDARTAGEIKAEIHSLGGDLGVILDEFLFRIALFRVHLNGGPHGVAGNQENCENDELAHTEYFFLHWLSLKGIKNRKTKPKFS